MYDWLSDILMRLSVEGVLYFRRSFTPPFGVRVPKFSNVARFHYVQRGTCMVSVAGIDQPVTLAQGDLLIVPHGATHCLFSPDFSPEDAPDLDTVLKQAGYQGKGVFVHGGETSTKDTQLICGHFSFTPGGRHMIFERLPPYLHVTDYGENIGPWFSDTLRMLGNEAARGQPGGDLIALRLSETILAQALRHYLQGAGARESALAGFADPFLARALAAMHEESVARLDGERSGA